MTNQNQNHWVQTSSQLCRYKEWIKIIKADTRSAQLNALEKIFQVCLEKAKYSHIFII